MELSFVGLGAMGTRMARNLVRAGFAVRGFDAHPPALRWFAENGGQPAASVADAARGTDALILMVVNADQARQVLFDGGALDALAPDGIVVLMATCPPGSVRDLAERVLATGRAFVDAPVSGGTAGAEAATLTIMAAAPPGVFARLRPVLGAMGDKLFHVGAEPGLGATVKVVNQLLCGVHLAVAAEGLALAAKVGVDPQVALEILSGSSASSWMLRDRGPRMSQTDPAVTSAVDIFVKDLGIVLDAGREVKAATPLAAAAHQMFLAASGRGDGAVDDSQVIRSYHRLNRGD
ncbi:NAD(P)-dependent oxidoreductase [Paracoccus sediminis]|uniref:3-hydroxyisobutyrate dehydrogenase n=1 Tax=Paracoccus sediminis TaxID=1214787 RepID=A0A238WM84_9RHOB|nr:NAD(P)-dependent oxidoreductase [Paracoccus sediminis]TBN50485.1 NAD(P)-dependent oxidoreductase [Paracoccus sediminis]SNR47528.1 3-hydroxyisobutyrate dehydrogenase [Paracoccus sediminis]